MFRELFRKDAGSSNERRRAVLRREVLPLGGQRSGGSRKREGRPMSPISRGADWDFDLLERYDTAIANVAGEFGLDTYANQIEIITSEQMLDAYATSGLPVGYPHWSYGKEFIRNEQAYRRGMQGLAYEIVINSDPCIAYLMEENTMATQALVIAHACYGHNSFFKGNHLFRQWTSADAILDYLVFARRFVMECEERHGAVAVEEVLDACHALMQHGVDRYRRPAALTLKAETARLAEREAHRARQFNDLWRTLPENSPEAAPDATESFPAEPQENILYFVEKYSPKLEPWQRELVRIVRKLAQYFYPQAQTKVMNEGWATFWHYTILNRLHEQGLVDDGFMLEFLKSHTNVIAQPAFDSKPTAGSILTHWGSRCSPTCGASARRPTRKTANGSPSSPAATGAQPSTSRCAISRTNRSFPSICRRA